MTMRFLTRSYVEAIGLEQVPVQLRRDSRVRLAFDLALPEAGPSAYSVGVFHDGHLYTLEAEGLSYRRHTAKR